tara:strand:- start:153 stop:479 length:327 start_codon:yes stop_codon:yes gene_type:complete
MNYDDWKLSTPEDEMSYAPEVLEADDVSYWLKEQGAENIDVRQGEIDVDVTFDYEGAYYILEDLTLLEYEDINSIKGMIAYSDDRGTVCCDASFDDDHRRCNNCKEAF